MVGSGGCKNGAWSNISTSEFPKRVSFGLEVTCVDKNLVANFEGMVDVRAVSTSGHASLGVSNALTSLTKKRIHLLYPVIEGRAFGVGMDLRWAEKVRWDTRMVSQVTVVGRHASGRKSRISSAAIREALQRAVRRARLVGGRGGGGSRETLGAEGEGEANINMHNFPSFSKKALDLEAKIGHGHMDGRKKTLPPNWKAKGRIMFVNNDGSTIELDDEFQAGIGSEAGSVEASGGGVVAVVTQKGALITEFDLTDDVTRSLVEAYREDQFMSEIIHRLEAKDGKTFVEFELVNGLLFLEKAGNKRLPHQQITSAGHVSRPHQQTMSAGHVSSDTSADSCATSAAEQCHVSSPLAWSFLTRSQTAAMDHKPGETAEAYQARMLVLITEAKQRSDAVAAAEKKKAEDAEKARLLAIEQQRQHDKAAAKAADEERSQRREKYGVVAADLYTKISWDDLKAVWHKWFQIEPSEIKAMDKLLTFEQGTMPSGDWIAEFQRLASTSDVPMGFTAIKHYFITRSCPVLGNALTHVEETLTTTVELFNKVAQIIVTKMEAKNLNRSFAAGPSKEQHRPKVVVVAATM
ncbi:hypothetical protein CBR_g27874 [Chara braunii]|uniref:Uncharacterized protein n=1 Tax=Chara braunii TaxID=69332 RepID=A0A388L8Q0_CHABU|nr:hypothetical protein CBR_g27874 [Chara braunii]|eukprot:GBG78648.1 hypothetical protein CBR_g27874 [Chara braunii]